MNSALAMSFPAQRSHAVTLPVPPGRATTPSARVRAAGAAAQVIALDRYLSIPTAHAMRPADDVSPVTPVELKSFLMRLASMTEGEMTVQMPLIKGEAPYVLPLDTGNALLSVNTDTTACTVRLRRDVDTGAIELNVDFTDPVTVTNPGSTALGPRSLVGAVADCFVSYDLTGVRFDGSGQLSVKGKVWLLGVLPFPRTQRVPPLQLASVRKLLAAQPLSADDRAHLERIFALVREAGAMTRPGRYTFRSQTQMERTVPLVLDAGRIPLHPTNIRHSIEGEIDLDARGDAAFTVARNRQAEHTSRYGTADISGHGTAKLDRLAGLDVDASFAVICNDLDLMGTFEPTHDPEDTRVPLRVHSGTRETPPVALHADVALHDRRVEASGELVLTDFPASVGDPADPSAQPRPITFPLGSGTMTTTGIDANISGRVDFSINRPPNTVRAHGGIDLTVSDEVSKFALERDIEVTVDTARGQVVVGGRARRAKAA